MVYFVKRLQLDLKALKSNRLQLHKTNKKCILHDNIRIKPTKSITKKRELRMAFKWTEEHIASLKKLWMTNLTAREIAERIDSKLSRNAVIGKANRLNLSSDSGTITTNKLSKSLLENIPGDRHCQWLSGHPSKNEFTFCFESVVPNKPYCAKHCAKAYRRIGI